ncbi:hypothetical protein CDD82_5905 [Ophiocordyceps australis]|uniref:Uncharacterized protein n=1 Tax=Ophiocordyceps australis TaxID=1399860 RepID=A0A2C5Y3A3_9HYPO|nr:hypothetical protein CDD82_5905 [Ophiocordyceps australis]
MLRLAQRRAQNAHLVDCLAQQTAAIDALLARLDAAKLDVVAAAQALDPDNDALSCPAAPDDASNASTAATQPATSTAPTLDSAPNPPDAAGTTHAADAATS